MFSTRSGSALNQPDPGSWRRTSPLAILFFLGKLLRDIVKNAWQSLAPIAALLIASSGNIVDRLMIGAGVALIDEITARSSGHDNVIARHLDPPLQFEVAILHAESDPFSIINQQFINHLKNEIHTFLNVPLVNGT